MTIQVKFFASLREQLGVGEAEVSSDEANTVAEVWKQVLGETVIPENTLMSVNLEYVDAAHEVKSGDEVAFFPPVTGG